MSLFAVKNDKGEWLYSDEYNDWVYQLSQASFYDTFEDADDDIECWELSNAYVVELAEAPAKVVVNEKEASLLEKMADGTNFNGERGFEPGLVITNFVLNNPVHGESHFETEDRLMRAYVNDWTVEKPKRWNVKVPYADGWIFQKYSPESKRKHHNLSKTFPVRDTGLIGRQLELTRFTLAEMEQYDLIRCEHVEVTGDDAKK